MAADHSVAPRCHFQLGSPPINPDPQNDFTKQLENVKLYPILRIVKRPHESSAVAQISELAVIITVGVRGTSKGPSDRTTMSSIPAIMVWFTYDPLSERLYFKLINNLRETKLQ